MEILVDDQPYQPAGPPEQTVRELTDEVCQTSPQADHRLVVANSAALIAPSLSISIKATDGLRNSFTRTLPIAVTEA